MVVGSNPVPAGLFSRRIPVKVYLRDDHLFVDLVHYISVSCVKHSLSLEHLRMMNTALKKDLKK